MAIESGSLVTGCMMGCMTQLVPARQRLNEVIAVLRVVEAEGSMDINAAKEAAYAKQEGQRFAIVDESDTVVGYLSGRYAGAPQNPGEAAKNEVMAFVSLILLAASARGRGHGSRAMRDFAMMADDASATLVRLNLDQAGDVAGRQRAFEKMGFRFNGDQGTATIAELLLLTES